MGIRIANLIRKELIQFGRDRMLTLFLILAPALQLILLAQAIEQGVNEQPVVLLDQDHSRASRQLTTALDNSEELWVRFHVEAPDEMQQLLDAGRARLGVVIPAGFARALQRPDAAPGLQLIADGAHSVAAQIAMSAASGIVDEFSAGPARERGRVVPEWVDLRTNVQFNPTLNVQDYSIPAQLGFITYQVTLAVAALGLARERELGTLEQLMVTPLSRLELILGKGIPAFVIGWANFCLMLVISVALFGVPLNGSPMLLAALTAPFIATVVGWGLFISSLARTQQQAILFVFILALVEIAFSGFLVPVDNMPALLQAVSRFAPLQHYLVIVRSVMLKGAGLSALRMEALSLVALSAIMGAVALRSVALRLE